MVMDFKNWNDLKKAIEKKTKKSLETNVKDLVRKEANKQILNKVYNSYQPTMYKRTYSLFKLDRYKHKISGDIENGLNISIEHVATSKDGKNLSKLIILGQEGAKKYNEDIAKYNDLWILKTKKRFERLGISDDGAFYQPRDFISATKEELSKDQKRKKMVFELKKGMR